MKQETKIMLLFSIIGICFFHWSCKTKIEQKNINKEIIYKVSLNKDTLYIGDCMPFNDSILTGQLNSLSINECESYKYFQGKLSNYDNIKMSFLLMDSCLVGIKMRFPVYTNYDSIITINSFNINYDIKLEDICVVLDTIFYNDISYKQLLIYKPNINKKTKKDCPNYFFSTYPN